jgi:predicted nuclease of predicted toxin-antitoxin system
MRASWGLGSSSDIDLCRYAAGHGYAVVTLDSDFAELALLMQRPPNIVWLRCGNAPTPVIDALLRHHSSQILMIERNE